MSPDAPTLAFVLDAPLQSWGTESRFQRRGTALHPSKSAVLGMIAAAIGMDKYAPDAEVEQAPLTALTFACAALPRAQQTRRGPRTLRFRQLTDYHTVGGGYDKEVEPFRIPHSAERGIFGTMVTHRTYLTDARFLILLQGDVALLEQISRKLRDPVWGLWLGRKSCPPALPVHPALAPVRDAAIAAALSPLGAAPAWESMERWEEQPAPSPQASLINDQPVNFSSRAFRPRAVRHFHAASSPDSSPDAMFDAV